MRTGLKSALISADCDNVLYQLINYFGGIGGLVQSRFLLNDQAQS